MVSTLNRKKFLINNYWSIWSIINQNLNTVRWHIPPASYISSPNSTPNSLTNPPLPDNFSSTITENLLKLQNNLSNYFKTFDEVDGSLSSIESRPNELSSQTKDHAEGILIIKRDLVSFNERLTTIEVDSATTNTTPNVSVNGGVIWLEQDVTSEMQDRILRSHNVIMYNVTTDPSISDIDNTYLLKQNF